MDRYTLFAIVRPFGAMLLFAAIIIPIELVLKRYWPENRLKRILFDRTFPSRRPWIYMLIWLAAMVVLFGSMSLVSA